jgi:hypothetical protein
MEYEISVCKTIEYELVNMWLINNHNDRNLFLGNIQIYQKYNIKICDFV